MERNETGGGPEGKDVTARGHSKKRQKRRLTEGMRKTRKKERSE